jgi:hypothetical protein
MTGGHRKMALMRLIDKTTYDALPDVLKSEYAKEGDNYLLETDDASYKTKIGEFRSNNVELLKAQTDLKKEMVKFKDIDPVKYAEMQTKLDEISDKKMIEEGKLEELLTQRVERYQEEHDSKYTALEGVNSTLIGNAKTQSDKIKVLMIGSKITAAVNDIGVVRKGAMVDIISRAKKVWELDDDLNLVPKKDGNIYYGEDGKNPITPEEYAKSLYTEAPYLFESSKGGGSQGNEDHKNVDGKVTVIDKHDKELFGNNLEDIASGKILAQ